VGVDQFDKKAARAPKDGAKKNSALAKMPGTLPRRVVITPKTPHIECLILGSVYQLWDRRNREGKWFDKKRNELQDGTALVFYAMKCRKKWRVELGVCCALRIKSQKITD
jgi:hypothetical protein